MEYIILILIVFIFINTLLKLSFRKWWQVAIFGLLCVGFILLVYPYAITRSKTELTGYLNDTRIMQDIAVLITFESVIYLAFCFSAMRRLYGSKAKLGSKFLSWYPGLLMFPALFYVYTNVIFRVSGLDFAVTAYVLAAVVFVLLILLSLGIKWLLPEKELRLEVQFLVSLFVAVIGLISTVNGRTVYAASSDPLNINVLAPAIGLFILFFAIGYAFNKYKWKIKRNTKS